ncbi:MAG: hypothetical protein ABI811_09125 [Acidobacteriota bacterium]
MKQLLSTLFALLALAAIPLFAAKRIQMESTDLTSNKATVREILIDTDRMRVNDGDTSVLFLTKGGNRMVILNKTGNTYQEIDQATMDRMGAQMGGAMAQLEEAMKNMPPAQRAQMEQMMKGKLGGPASASPSAAAVAPTTYAAKGPGTAGAYRCTLYEGSQSGQKISEICAATPVDLKLSASDFQVMERMREYLSVMTKALQNSPMAGAISDSGLTKEGINGFPVQTITYKNGKATERDVLKGVVDAPLTDADFSTGTAKKTDMGIPNVGKGKGK